MKNFVIKKSKIEQFDKGVFALSLFSPERYVNHSSNTNTYQDIKKKCDIALRDIKKGEEITTNSFNDDMI